MLAALSTGVLPMAVAPEDAAVVAAVTLATQTMTLFHNGEAIGHWPVSTARTGKITPTGAWRAQWLSRHHRSSLYDNAPMPYAVFFNGDYAVHGTDAVYRLGQPASAGCVRLDTQHARVFFELALREGLQNTVVVIRP
ncbi:L,D-transpeptidase [Lutibaculum baratangense]|nr:L,D-transpeptidase [Lutibaculum baratangense]